ncbi:MAG: glutamate racemase [Flavobacteriales bacterium]|nr:glutamate racemase [Flavobacteriales bacterium]|tara:strand:- start:475 stop:1290 length:816 start_codon:yes stop_codon:yes gene_type:complete
MEQKQPIGIFDSGIGGLTVAKAISALLPYEQIIYFGDTAHFPYGDKSKESIQNYSKEISTFLLKQNCKAIVVACNTASSLASSFLKLILPKDFPLIDVIVPVANFLQTSDYKKVGVIATKGTINSRIYPKRINELSPDIQVSSLATPLLAPMIEEAFFDNNISHTVINEYLSHKELHNIDALILGCTHYPLIESEINQFYSSTKKNVFVVNSAKVVAQEVKKVLKHKSLLSTSLKKEHHFYVSDFTDSFEKSTKIFFGNELTLKKENIWGG